MEYKENEEGVKISFIKVLKYIESGETANVTINGKQYNIYVNPKDEQYYINDDMYKNREEFINGIYKKASIQLSKNSKIILNSIADGTVKVDSNWNFEDKDQINIKNKKPHKLYRNIVIKIMILYFFILVMSYIFYNEISIWTDTTLNIIVYKNRILDNEWFTFNINKKIIASLLIINNISMIFFEENRMRLMMLFKYSRKRINEIEEKVIKYENENLIFGGKYNICFEEENLIIMRKSDFRIINYKDIVHVLDIQDYLQKEEREICIITKNKKVIRLGNVVHREELKKRLAEKNSKIIFKKSKNIGKSQILNLEDVNINIKNILFKDIVTTNYKIWSKVISIFLALYYIFNQRLLNDVSAILIISNFIFCTFFVFVVFSCMIYNKNKLRRH